MSSSFRPWIFVAVLALGLVTRLRADVTLPKIFSDGMVLQREMPIPVWGRAAAGEKISVSLAGTQADATADAHGHWMVKLPAVKAGGPHVLTVRGATIVEFKDVLVGEVWICSGQSNMAFPVSASTDAQREIAEADYPMIREFKVPHLGSPVPQADLAGKWVACSPATAGGFTAVGYFFGLELHKKLDAPIGLIDNSWGGMRIEPYTPREELPRLVGQPQPETRAAAHQKPMTGVAANVYAASLWNAMVHPLVPYAIRGAIWYQGEANISDGLAYTAKMDALIKGWRRAWGQGDFPFYYVQLAPHNYGAEGPEKLALMWEAQSKALAIPNTGMACTVDIGDPNNLHPKKKKEVGRRLALWALAKTYGQDKMIYSGPTYKSVKFKDAKAIVKFEHVGGGLVSRDGNDLTWFTIAGSDKTFTPAQARIEGDTVVVWSEKVATPAAVRFAWNQVAQPNLMNVEGLPAAPFRTDAP